MSFLYQAEYFNSVVAAVRADGMRFSLVAGTHGESFPYFGEDPWDNVLLCVGDQKLQQTLRNRSLVRFDIDASLDRGKENCSLVLDGSLTSVESGKELPVHIQIDMVAMSFPARQEGKEYNLLDVSWLPGLRWHPFSIQSGVATVQVGDEQWVFDHATGQIEHGLQSNFRSESFAFYYDYQALVRPGANAYTYLSFQTHALGRGFFSRLLNQYLTRFASEELTFLDGKVVRGNPHQVGISDDLAVLFENVVDLKLCRLRRQFVGCHDKSGGFLTGLREIFERYPGAR
jgi:hypothetical protein